MASPDSQWSDSRVQLQHGALTLGTLSSQGTRLILVHRAASLPPYAAFQCRSSAFVSSQFSVRTHALYGWISTRASSSSVHFVYNAVDCH